MTLQQYQFQRREFNFRSRKKFTRYTPSQWEKKNKEVDPEAETEDEEEGEPEDEPEAEPEAEPEDEPEDEQALTPRMGVRQRVRRGVRKAPNSSLRRIRTEGASSPEVPPRRRRN